MARISYQRLTILLVIIATFFLKSAHTEVFTALSDMEGLIQAEAMLIDNLESYLDKVEARASLLRKKVEEYQREHEEAADDIAAYIGNPINAYLLTKRLTSEWKFIQNLMKEDLSMPYIQNITHMQYYYQFPTNEDLEGAAAALMRLQVTYNLDTSSVARGILNGVQLSSELTSADCFELGRQSYLRKDYHHTVQWMNEALERMELDGNFTKPASKSDILEYLAFSTYYEGDTKKALEITNQLLEVAPDNPNARGNIEAYELELKTLHEMQNIMGDDGSETVPVSDYLIESSDLEETLTNQEKYELLCRGDIRLNATEERPMRCKYWFSRDPFMKIAPFKMEEVFLDPYIVVFYDVLSDNEIEIIKTKAKPKFQRATVLSEIGPVNSDVRVGKFAWMYDNEHKLYETIAQRVEDITGLSKLAYEELQVVNYGIGGHYEIHHDFGFGDQMIQSSSGVEWGNRIATLLFYMNDVKQGGSTVFPMLNTGVKPKKGMAVFWYNLYRSGNRDFRTLHASCPVLEGTKWICNKWIHIYHQEFRRPCLLKPDQPPGQDQ